MLITGVEEAGRVVVPEVIVVLGATELSGCELGETADEELAGTLELAGFEETDSCVVDAGWLVDAGCEFATLVDELALVGAVVESVTTLELGWVLDGPVVDVGICVSLVLAPEVEDALVSDAGGVELGATVELADIVELVAATLMDEERITDVVAIIGRFDSVVEVPTNVPVAESVPRVGEVVETGSMNVPVVERVPRIVDSDSTIVPVVERMPRVEGIVESGSGGVERV